MSDVITKDLVIIGGGPAGMMAALYAARAKLDTVVLESNVTGGLVNSTPADRPGRCQRCRWQDPEHGRCDAGECGEGL